MLLDMLCHMISDIAIQSLGIFFGLTDKIKDHKLIRCHPINGLPRFQTILDTGSNIKKNVIAITYAQRFIDIFKIINPQT